MVNQLNMDKILSTFGFTTKHAERKLALQLYLNTNSLHHFEIFTINHNGHKMCRSQELMRDLDLINFFF